MCMKKLITLIIVFVAFVNTQAQNIPLTNGDCSTDATFSGASPYVFPGFTIIQTSPAALNLTTSGVSGGKLKIFGTTNGSAQGNLSITTDKIDISSYAADATFTFACNFTCQTPTSAAQPYNVTVYTYDASGTVISTGVTSTVLTSLTKIQENSNAAAGTVINCGAVAVMNNAMGNCKYIAFQLQMGKMLTNNLTIDDFTLYHGKVPTFNVTPTANLALSTEAGVASNESSFTVDGSALTSDILIFGGSNLEMSTTSGSGFTQDTIKLTHAGDGSLASTIIYGRIKAGVTSVPTASTTMGNSTIKASVYHKGSGTKTVQFTGTLTGFASTLPAVDTLTASPLSAASKNIKITANSLTADLIVSAGTKLEIATDSLFTSPQSSIILPNVGDTVYVRLKKGLPIGLITDETTKVSITSTGFISKSIQFVGNSVAATAVSNVSESAIKCFVKHGILYISDIKAGLPVDIYNSIGQKVKSLVASDYNAITLPVKGMFVVKTGTYVRKIVVK